MSESSSPLGSRRFSATDQEWFAEVSGDRNPLHVDAILARRLMFGEPVVHGVHLVLWAVDRLLANEPLNISRLETRFIKPVLVSEEVHASSVQASPDRAMIRLECSGVTVATIQLGLSAEPTGRIDDDRSERSAPDIPPRDLDLEGLHDLEGYLEIPIGDGTLEAGFPHATSQLGAAALAQIAALSRLVGMECPGLHSLFGTFNVDLDPSGSTRRLRWAVSRVDNRFSACHISVFGGRITGRVTAFVRPKPVRQPSTLDLAKRVTPDEFAHVVALVVGGSRGLGELAAKIIGAGGGTVIITWRSGHSDAEHVVTDIRSAGGQARSIPLDVHDPGRAIGEALKDDRPFSHLYYFASPRISRRRLEPFSSRLLAEFIDAYVVGFVRTIECCRNHGLDDLIVVYPSTVFVDEGPPDLIEYAIAKGAGEVAAQLIEKSQPGFEVLIERLPRLATDQTAALAETPETMDPVTLMLPLIRAASGRAAASPDDARTRMGGHDPFK